MKSTQNTLVAGSVTYTTVQKFGVSKIYLFIWKESNIFILHQIDQKWQQTFIMLQKICISAVFFDQINAALLNIRDFLQKH